MAEEVGYTQAEYDAACKEERDAGYDAGYDDGKDASNDTAYSDGHSEGYNQGITEGTLEGKADGFDFIKDKTLDLLESKKSSSFISVGEIELLDSLIEEISKIQLI